MGSWAKQGTDCRWQTVLEQEEPLDLSTMFLDTTCVKANIHFRPIGYFCETESRA
jgi:hypothetical protein